MPIPAEALELENRSGGVHGEPTLAAAYDILKRCWRGGDRDRELALHLFFICWYGLVEPLHLTGFENRLDMSEDLNEMLAEAHAYLEPRMFNDAEVLYVTGLAAHLFWFMFEDSETWRQRSIEYRTDYRMLAPNGIDPSVFHNRGAYGRYYAHQAAVKNGY
jgi:hypothetical protein